MSKATRLISLMFGLLVVSSSCIPAPQVMNGNSSPVLLENVVIDRDTTWQGAIRIKGLVEVKKGVTLTIRPGTEVNFTWMDKDADGVGDSELIIRGRLIAQGTPEQLILFTSKTKAAANAWMGIRFEEAKGGDFKYCYFTFANWGLHIHFTPIDIEYCRFEYNEGGIRFYTNPIVIRHNLIQNNKIGIRFLNCAPVIEDNTIKNNLTGIFVRQGATQPSITQNNIYQNENYNLKLGEEQVTDVNCPNNYWGTTDKAVIEAKIYDRQDSSYLGRVNYEPILGAPLGTSWSP